MSETHCKGKYVQIIGKHLSVLALSRETRSRDNTGGVEYTASQELDIQQSIDTEQTSQGDLGPDIQCRTLPRKTKRVSFAEVLSNNSEGENRQRLCLTKEDEEKGEHWPQREETATYPGWDNTLHSSHEPDNEALNEVVDFSLVTYVTVSHDNRGKEQQPDSPELLRAHCDETKELAIDTAFKPGSPEPQAGSSDQTRPVKHLENESIQSVTVKKLREVQFSPTTFRRRTITADLNVNEQLSLTSVLREAAGKLQEEWRKLQNVESHKVDVAESRHSPVAPPEASGRHLCEKSDIVETTHTIHSIQSTRVSISCGLTTATSSDYWTREDSQREDRATIPSKDLEPTHSERKEDEGLYVCTAEGEGESCEVALRHAGDSSYVKDKEDDGKKLPERRKLHSYYNVKEEIGRGSSGFVKRVVSKQSGMQGAAKFIPLRRSTSSQAFRELAILSRVNHPRITCLLDMFETKRTLVLVLDLCSSEKLLDHLLKKDVVTEVEIQSYIQQVLEAIQYLHDKHILHLDIKPDNILMVHPERDGIKICDFGFAQELSPGQFSKYGSPEFVGPEIVSQNPVSKATDIWSIGVLTFLCLTGSSPFAGENDKTTLLNVGKGAYSWAERDLECVSEDARDFVQGIIKVVPKDRPSAAQCLRHRWLQEKQTVQEARTIKTKRLKFFISRTKWQRSLTCYRSVLVMRSIPDLLGTAPQSCSLGMPRHLFKDNSSSTPSASSSDFEDSSYQSRALTFLPARGTQRNLQHWGDGKEQRAPTPTPDNLSAQGSNHDKHDRPMLTGGTAVERKPQTVITDLLAEGAQSLNKYPQALTQWSLSQGSKESSVSQAAALGTFDHVGDQGEATDSSVLEISMDQALALQTQGEERAQTLVGGSSDLSRILLPRHSVISSTFYSESHGEQGPCSSSLDSTRERIAQAGYSTGNMSGLRQPLLESLQTDGQHITAERAASAGPGEWLLTAGCSLYSAERSPRKSKSLDELEAKVPVRPTSRASESKTLQPFPQCDEDCEPDSSAVVFAHYSNIAQPVYLGQRDSAMTQFKSGLYEEDKDPAGVRYGLEYFTQGLPLAAKANPPAHTGFASPPHPETEVDLGLGFTTETCLAGSSESHRGQSLQTGASGFWYGSLAPQNTTQALPPASDEGIGFTGQGSVKQYSDDPNLLPSVSQSKCPDWKGSSECPSRVSSALTSDLSSQSQGKASRDNTSSSYFEAVEAQTDYFDLSDPCHSDLPYRYSALLRPEDAEEKSVSKDRPIPAGYASEEQFPLGDTEAAGAIHSEDTMSGESSEVLCDETGLMDDGYSDLAVDIWESDMLQLLDDTELNESNGGAGDGTEGESDKKRRSSLERKMHLTFQSLKKTFKTSRGSKSSASSSEASLSRSESHAETLPKSTAKKFGKAGLLGLFRRSTSLNWDQGLADREDGRSRYSLSVLQDLDSHERLRELKGKRKSKTLPASLEGKSAAENSGREERQKRYSDNPLVRTDPLKVELDLSQYMEIVTTPIRSAPIGQEDGAEGRLEASQTSTGDLPSHSVKKKSRLFSFQFPGTKAKGKAPSFLEGLQSQLVVLNQSVTLSCTSSGQPNPEIHWFKDDLPVCSSKSLKLSATPQGCQLVTIWNATEKDLGLYECVAENSFGKASTSCSVTGAVVPCRPDAPAVAQVYEDGALVIWKPVESNTPVTYVVECQRKGESWKIILSDGCECSCYASNLQKGEAYFFKIGCFNTAGKGPFSRPSVEIVIGETEVQSHSLHDKMLTPVYQAYTFCTEINRGRSSVIHQCTEISSGKLFAAKITPYKKQNHPSALREYETLRELHHRSIVELHGAYITPDYLLLVEELCRGKEVLHHLAERASYSEHLVMLLLDQLLEAVRFLHSNHTLHLDLRSENILIGDGENLKLLDFGNAQHLTPGRPAHMGKCRDFVENMAPEILEGEALVPQTDIWAVGVLTFAMLSGDCPFTSDKESDKERNIRKGKVKIGRCYTGLSQAAVSFLKNCLCRNAGGRPSASDCLAFPWFQEDSRAKLRHSTVSFPTPKLRSYLKQREKRRKLLCTKHKVLLPQ